MEARDAELMTLVRAIVASDGATVTRLLAATPALARASLQEGATRQSSDQWYLVEINHYLYAGDTALHAAAAGHRPASARALVDQGVQLATWTTGRGGSGSSESKAQQAEIRRLLQDHGVRK